MATYALIHGAGDSAFYWSLVAPLLRDRGHQVAAPDLPIEDDAAGWADYTEAVVDAIGDNRDLVLVAQSAGGFTAPLVAARLPTDLLVFVAGMIPRPGESPADYWINTRYGAAPRDPRAVDEISTFYQDVPRAVAKDALAHGRRQADHIGDLPWPLDSWPHVPCDSSSAATTGSFQPSGYEASSRIALGSSRTSLMVAIARPWHGPPNWSSVSKRSGATSLARHQL